MRLAARVANLLAAVVVSGLLLGAGAAGAGPLPPLGPAFNPARGVWTTAADASAPHGESLRLEGLQRPARVTFEADGVAHLTAATDHDLFLAEGYVTARFRLFQMDLERRQGEGRLAQVLGPAALPTDRFELELGLIRTARAEWAMMDPATRAVVLAYAEGVNDRIDEDRAGGDFPALFRLLGYEPAPWTPLDTLAVKGDMTQDLAYQTTPIDYSLLVNSLGYRRTMSWFPLLPVGATAPYDPGPYGAAHPAALPAATGELGPTGVATVASLRRRLAALPDGWLAAPGESNNWAVDGSKSATGAALLAGDPHLHLTLPSIWFQLTGDSPGYHFAGVSIPGTPGIIIGHNRHIAWSLTDTEDLETLYYREETDRAHPDEYFWRGAWRRFRHIVYAIPVQGRPPARLDVELSVHGPLLTQSGMRLAVWWTGNQPDQLLRALRGILQASDYGQFRTALSFWAAPNHNFVYADDHGHIGLISAGLYPLVSHGQPWLPLSGTGPEDVTGAVPFAQVPQVYDPPQHFTFSANQRPVTAAYPYFIGTSLDFEVDYRALEIRRFLSSHPRVTVAEMEALQNDTRDQVAADVVPRLLATVPAGGAARLLAGWDDRMDVNSPAATIWWVFWNDYLRDTFGPWWSRARVPESLSSFAPHLTPLLDDLTRNDPHNPVFAGPAGGSADSGQVMRTAFQQAEQQLTHRFGPDPATWRWGRYHRRTIASLALITSLGYGPRAAPGDEFTPDRGLVGGSAGEGPSWRMVVNWEGADFGVYPGGQTENPASPWYENRVNTWWAGAYDRMLTAGEAAAAPGAVTWSLRP